MNDRLTPTPTPPAFTPSPTPAELVPTPAVPAAQPDLDHGHE